MVGVVVGNDLARQRILRDQGLPVQLHIAHVHAGIDGAPAAVAVGDQPQIDVVERIRQRHAYPAHALIASCGCERHGSTGFRQGLAAGVVDGVHAAAVRRG
jgi:hypothetical protein